MRLANQARQACSKKSVAARSTPSASKPLIRMGIPHQRNNSYINLMDFHSRWFDPVLGRWTQPDSIIPDENPQSLNRFSYVGNNPINFNDPSGHMGCADIPSDSPARASCEASGNLDEYGVSLLGWDSSANVQEINLEVKTMANKLAEAYGSYCSNTYYNSHLNCTEMSSANLFHAIYGDKTIQYDPSLINDPCNSNSPGKIICGTYVDTAVGSGTFLGPDLEAQGLHQISHEFGHQFDAAIDFQGRSVLGGSTIRTPDGSYVSGVIGGNYVRSPQGYAYNGNMPGVSHKIDSNNTNCSGGSACEDFADMYMNWSWDSFDVGAYGDARYYWMDSRMGPWIALAVSGP
jgi:RHS repeat-associated protein